jgi:hypothetical protein
MSEHLDRATQLYRAWLDNIDQEAADDARTRAANEAHASLVARQTHNLAGTADDDTGD